MGLGGVKAPKSAGRLRWFQDARLGLFVHWGPYSVLGRGEQIIYRDIMPEAEYRPLAMKFRPPKGWARRLAREARAAGMKYVVLTTRHGDGYCLFGTAADDFNAVRTGPGRDLVAEFAAACRAEGLRVGFYYSLLNWRWRGYWSPERHPEELPRMVEQVHAQVRELMTGYGKVDILWFDAGLVPGEGGHGMWGLGRRAIPQPTGEFYRSRKLLATVRRLQPEILINNRAGLEQDFGTPEQRVSPEGQKRAWEACMTINFAPGWGYVGQSVANKSVGEVLFHLVDAVRMGGNFLLNVGPRADGSLDRRELSVLRPLGRWLARHGEAVYGTRPTGIFDLSEGRVQGPMFHYGMWTCRGRTGYLTLFYYPGETLVVSKIGPRIRSATLLTTGKRLKVERTTNDRWLIRGLPRRQPDRLAAVVKVEFAGPPYGVADLDSRWVDGQWRLP
jgi:alpha-L-fucosidase